MPGFGLFTRMPSSNTAQQQSPEGVGVMAGTSGGAGSSYLNYDYTTGAGLPGQPSTDPTQPPPVYDCLGNPTILTGLIWTPSSWSNGVGATMTLTIPIGLGPDDNYRDSFVSVSATLCNPTTSDKTVHATFTSITFIWDQLDHDDIQIYLSNGSGLNDSGLNTMLECLGSPIGFPVQNGPQDANITAPALSLTSIQFLVRQSNGCTANAVIALSLI
jgi:hypothetical protein